MHYYLKIENMLLNYYTKRGLILYSSWLLYFNFFFFKFGNFSFGGQESNLLWWVQIKNIIDVTLLIYYGSI